jgi:hypothetical protein
MSAEAEQPQAPEHPPELAALLADPNLLPSEREALQRLLAVSLALDALTNGETE